MVAKKKQGTLVVIGGHEDKEKEKEILREVSRRTGYLGGGIDEDTAIIVHDAKSFEVIGSGAVYVLDGSGISYSNLAEEEQTRDCTLTVLDIKIHLLGSGFGFDLQERRPQPVGQLVGA